ncbi:MAG: DUF1285 domain-containing protein [Gammaproteobacteria bacterium]|nr:DUF1285 domain-containing protein [Gammaproteobacteria bacterium]
MAGKEKPPVHLWHPESVGDIDIRIDRHGQWWHEGALIERQRLVRLFSTVLRRDEDGEYYLVTPVEKCRIQVEDVPFQAILLEIEGLADQQQLYITTNVADRVLVDTSHPLRFEFDPITEEPSPYVLVRDGLEARLVRSVYYQLAALCVERASWLGVWSAGHFFRLLKMT